MKNNCLLGLIGLFMVVCLIGGCSGGGNEEIPSPPPVVEKDYVNVTTDPFIQPIKVVISPLLSLPTNPGLHHPTNPGAESPVPQVTKVLYRSKCSWTKILRSASVQPSLPFRLEHLIRK